MDNTLWGVIIGSVLSLVGNGIQQWFAAHKAAQEFDRTQTAEELAWKRNTIKEQASEIRGAYQNAIYALSMVATVKESEELNPGGSCYNFIRDAIKWISLIYIRHPGEELHFRIKEFVRWPESSADRLRDYVGRLAKADTDLFSLPPIAMMEEPKMQNSRDKVTLEFQVAPDFRRERLIDSGVQLVSSDRFLCKLQDLTEIQRKLLVDASPNFPAIPSQMPLPFPTHDTRKNVVNGRGGSWKARLDPPCIDNLEEIQMFLAVWESEYVSKFAELEELVMKKDSESM
ncbi:hypothetical protein [Blastopirellula marina]|uniref:Uncharacterized protein n=1 Tax=Blastopirellula marina DSM 3645 TaxID=314230 RepID=A3ZYV4_9BACT|nr:hypothetical protein [Blastopirellula marina]EAQ78315.1 hypothetical protein DSM3645_18301 [Blastopirellula marina DSM 3645]